MEIRVRSATIRRRVLMVASIAWGLVITARVFLGYEIPMGGCWRLVGRTQACVDELNAMATRTFYSQAVPTVALFVGGLALLAVLWLDLSRRRALMVCAAAALMIASFAIVGTPQPTVWEPLPLSFRLPAADLLAGFAA